LNLPFDGPAAPDERPLKVCLASMAPFVGGAEVAAERLALGLRAAGHDVFLLLGRSGAVLDRMEKAGLRCLVSAMYHTDKWHTLRYWRARRALAQILRQERPDVVHSNDLPTHQIVSDAARALGAPRVCHHRFPFPRAATDWLNKFGGERHLFVSQALMEEVCAESARLQAAPREVVHDGLPLPPDPAPADRLAARLRLGLPAHGALVTFAGQIIERKGVADLIRAWGRLGAEVRGSAQLVIVGDDLAGQGAYRDDMERLARETDCPAKFVGFQKDVGEWLLASDVAVVPSHVEPLGNATLEAMAYALPVIGCRVGGIPEMVVHEQTGLLVPPRDPGRLAEALARLIVNAPERGRLGERARRRCSELFSLEAHARAVEGQYRIALGPAPLAGAVAAS
jgi:glycosyltransferase involved in cell wall biosynthesis